MAYNFHGTTVIKSGYQPGGGDPVHIEEILKFR